MFTLISQCGELDTSWMAAQWSSLSSFYPFGCVVYLCILLDSVYVNMASLQYQRIKMYIELTLAPFHGACGSLRALRGNRETKTSVTTSQGMAVTPYPCHHNLENVSIS